MVALFRGHWCFLIKEKEKMRFKSSLWQSGMAFTMVQTFFGLAWKLPNHYWEAWVYCGNKVFHTLMSCTNAERCGKSWVFRHQMQSWHFKAWHLSALSLPFHIHARARLSNKPFTFQELTPAIVCQPNSNLRFLSFPEMEFVIEHYWDLVCTVFNM